MGGSIAGYWSVGGTVNGMEDAIEVSNKEGGDGQSQVRMEAGKEKISVLKIVCWSMDVNEGQGSNRGQLGITWT